MRKFSIVNILVGIAVFVLLASIGLKEIHCAPGDIRVPTESDTNGVVLTRSLVITNFQWRLTVSPTNLDHIIRVRDLLFGVSNANFYFTGLGVTNGGSLGGGGGGGGPPVPGGNGSVIETNFAHASTPVAYTWSVVATLTTVASVGSVTLHARAMETPMGGNMYIRIRDVTTNTSSSTTKAAIGGATADTIETTMIDVLSGSPKTYYMELANSAGGATVWTNRYATGVGGVDSQFNTMGFRLVQHR